MIAMAQMASVQAWGAAQQQPHTPGQQQQAPAPLPEPQQAPIQPPTSPALQPMQYVQAQVQQRLIPQQVVAPQVVDWLEQIADVMKN